MVSVTRGLVDHLVVGEHAGAVMAQSLPDQASAAVTIASVANPAIIPISSP